MLLKARVETKKEKEKPSTSTDLTCCSRWVSLIDFFLKGTKGKLYCQPIASSYFLTKGKFAVAAVIHRGRCDLINRFKTCLNSTWWGRGG